MWATSWTSCSVPWTLACDSRQGCHGEVVGPAAQELTDEACARLSRNLTREEWKQHFGDEPYRATCPRLPAAPWKRSEGRAIQNRSSCQAEPYKEAISRRGKSRHFMGV